MKPKNYSYVLMPILLQALLIHSIALAEEATDKTNPKKVSEVNSELIQLNKTYMEDKARLEVIGPKGKEAKFRRDRILETEGEIEELIKREKEKYGLNWMDKYRDKEGKLPGGKLEDDKSRLNGEPSVAFWLGIALISGGILSGTISIVSPSSLQPQQSTAIKQANTIPAARPFPNIISPPC